jgi:hypothetical protein
VSAQARRPQPPDLDLPGLLSRWLRPALRTRNAGHGGCSRPSRRRRPPGCGDIGEGSRCCASRRNPSPPTPNASKPRLAGSVTWCRYSSTARCSTSPSSSGVPDFAGTIVGSSCRSWTIAVGPHRTAGGIDAEHRLPRPQGVFARGLAISRWPCPAHKAGFYRRSRQTCPEESTPGTPSPCSGAIDSADTNTLP